jgi:hypothetical protein
MDWAAGGDSRGPGGIVRAGGLALSVSRVVYQRRARCATNNLKIVKDGVQALAK